jgi:hypothetical protein
MQNRRGHQPGSPQEQKGSPLRRQVCQLLCQLGLTKSYIEGHEVRQGTTRTRSLTTSCNEMM